MKRFIFISFIFITQFSFGQKEIEDFINEVYHKVSIDSTLNYYNLADSSSLISLKDTLFDLMELMHFQKQHPDFPLEEFIAESRKAKMVDWNNFQLKKAKIAPIDQLPKTLAASNHVVLVRHTIKKSILDSLNQVKAYNKYYIPIRKTWSSKRIQREIDQTIKTIKDKIPLEDRDYYRFSTPLFAEDYALLKVQSSQGGVSYIFKKTKEKWTKIGTFNVFAF